MPNRFLLLRLKGGLLSASYGIAADINPDFTSQLNSYMETWETARRTNTRKRILKQIRVEDHAFGTSCTNIIGAMIRGFFPIESISAIEKEAA